jgi:hypothetical protein
MLHAGGGVCAFALTAVATKKSNIKNALMLLLQLPEATFAHWVQHVKVFFISKFLIVFDEIQGEKNLLKFMIIYIWQGV